MKNLQYVCFAVAVVLSGNVTRAVPITTSQSTATTKDAAKTAEQNKVEWKPKQLKCPQMRLLNTVFEELPYAVVRTKITCAKAAKALQAINELQKTSPVQATDAVIKSGAKKYFATEAEERLFITGHLKLLVDPIRQFFDLVRDYKSIVTPVIAESLGITTQETNKSLLLKFFETKEEASVFFGHAITSIDDLKNVGIEFIKVFGDVNESLSERARKLCDDIIRQMQEAQKQAAEQKAAEQKKA